MGRSQHPARLRDEQQEQLIAVASDMYEALVDLIGSARILGVYGPNTAAHRVGCECGFCIGVRALARYEQGGRCILCGCTQDDGCSEGCGWTDEERLLCDAHDLGVLREARRFLRRWKASWAPKEVA